MPASKIVSLFTVAIIALAAGQALAASNDPSRSVSGTWERAYVMISGSLVGSDRSYVGGEVRDRTLARHLESLASERDIPVVVALSDGAGDITALVRFAEPMMDLGVVFVVIDSRGRGADWIDCGRKECGEEQGRRSVEYRIEEAEFAYRRLMAFSWFSKDRSVLLGSSWGGMAAALYPGDDYGARMILSWTCSARNWTWLNGIHGSSNTPVFAAVAAQDPLYETLPWARGQCPVFGRPGSTSLVVEAAVHNVMTLLEVKQKAHRFLWGLFSGGAEQADDNPERHLLAPIVVEKSPDQIVLKPVGSTQEVYEWAKAHCGEFGKNSYLIRTMADGSSYAFVCE